jgi:NAD-dependent SIR2 family protein deacetylase
MDHPTVLDRFKIWIDENHPKNVVIISGAGISVKSGIPSYRGAHSSPLKIMKTAGSNSELFADSEFQEFVNLVKNAQPNQSHFFAKYLHDKGILKRIYTQNIDSLYQKAGIDPSVIVEFHGSIEKQNIILYGSEIGYSSLVAVEKDFVDEENVDLVIVMGTSLQVAPFCAIPNLVSGSCARVLVDINPTMSNNFEQKNQTSSVKFGKRRVTLRQKWFGKTKYKKQFIIEQDCSEFSQDMIEFFDSQTKS